MAARIKSVAAGDLVDEVLDRVSAEFGIERKKLSVAIERAIRRDWGGEYRYVAMHGEFAREERLQRDAAIRTDYRRGEGVPLLMRRYSLSEKRIRQIVSRGDDRAVAHGNASP